MAETFDLAPSSVWELSYAHNVLETQFESGKTLRRYKGARPREWHLAFKGKWSKISDVIDFFNDRKGSFEAFNWIPPGEEAAISVVFNESSLNVVRYGITSFGECELSLREVL